MIDHPILTRRILLGGLLAMLPLAARAQGSLLDQGKSLLGNMGSGTGGGSTASSGGKAGANLSQGDISSGLKEALIGAECFIGFGGQAGLNADDIAAMNRAPIVFEMANPHPEIAPESIENIARIIATGKSDYPNQINNMLCFPGFFRGLLDARASRVTEGMKIAAAEAIAETIGRDELHEDYLIPSVFDRRVAPGVAAAVAKRAKEDGVARRVTKGVR